MCLCDNGFMAIELGEDPKKVPCPLCARNPDGVLVTTWDSIPDPVKSELEDSFFLSRDRVALVVYNLQKGDIIGNQVIEDAFSHVFREHDTWYKYLILEPKDKG